MLPWRSLSVYLWLFDLDSDDLFPLANDFHQLIALLHQLGLVHGRIYLQERKAQRCCHDTYTQSSAVCCMLILLSVWPTEFFLFMVHQYAHAHLTVCVESCVITEGSLGGCGTFMTFTVKFNFQAAQPQSEQQKVVTLLHTLDFL